MPVVMLQLMSDRRPHSGRCPILWSCLALAVSLAASMCRPVLAFETPDVTIEETVWGFDGQACEGLFTPLSVLVRNNTPATFEGTLRLTKSLRAVHHVDAPIDREIYVGPMSTLWVQFYPYVAGDWEVYHLSWSTNLEERFEVPTPRMGTRATVLLYEPDVLAVSGGVLRRFNQDLFPPMVTATAGLRAVVMDAAPRWQAARREAFVDWLHRGGRVYLLPDEQGRYPQFPEALGLLNRPADTYRVGSGTVRRLSRSLSALDPVYVRETILAEPDVGRFSTASWNGLGNPQLSGALAPEILDSGWSGTESILCDLQQASRFERHWFAIYGLVLLYLLVLFPGCYRLGREARDLSGVLSGFGADSGNVLLWLRVPGTAGGWHAQSSPECRHRPSTG